MDAYRLDIKSDLDLREIAARVVAYWAGPSTPNTVWLRLDDDQLVEVTATSEDYEFKFECFSLKFVQPAHAPTSAPPAKEFERVPWSGAAIVRTLVFPEFPGLPIGDHWSGEEALSLTRNGQPLWRVPREVSCWCLVTRGIILEQGSARLLIVADAMPLSVCLTTDRQEIEERVEGGLLLEL